MAYPAYAEYQQSSCHSPREVPRDWECRRLKFAVTYNDASLPETTDPDFEIAYVDISSVDLIDGITAIEEMTFEEAPSRARRIVQGGDTIISTVRTYLKAIVPIEDPPENMIVSTGFAVIRPLEFVNQSFLGYVLQNASFVDEIVANSTGVSYPAINPSTLVCIPFSYPEDSAEQQHIADFLDWKTAQIDGLIAKKKQLVEKLQEKRIALITQAVTKGLNPNVPMRDSGIPWLGDVPEHWEVRRLKFIVESRKGAIKTGPFGSQLHSSEMIHNDVKVYNQKTVIERDIHGGDNYISEEKFQDLKAFEVFIEDLLITTRGTIGRCMVVPDGAQRGILHPCLMRIQVDNTLGFNRFIEILIQDSGLVLSQLQLMSNATTIEVIYSDSLKEVLIPTPPEDEQRSLTVFLDTETSKIDGLITKNNQLLERYAEYRTALVTAATTGKIDVRKVKTGDAA